MKTYFRLIAFSKPYSAYIPEYIVTALLSVIFGALNFGLLIPLLNVLFGTISSAIVSVKPEFHFSLSYFIDVFNFYFGKILTTQGKEGALAFVVLIILSSVLLANLFRYWSQRILSRMRSRMMQNLRKAVYEKFLVLHPGYFYHQ